MATAASLLIAAPAHAQLWTDDSDGKADASSPTSTPTTIATTPGGTRDVCETFHPRNGTASRCTALK